MCPIFPIKYVLKLVRWHEMRCFCVLNVHVSVCLTGPVTCKAGQVRCGDSLSCIASHLQCDGFPDCLNGEDELICGKCDFFIIICMTWWGGWYKGAKIWNGLPNEIKNSITLVEFKNQIKKWQGPKYLCNICTRLL